MSSRGGYDLRTRIHLWLIPTTCDHICLFLFIWNLNLCVFLRWNGVAVCACLVPPTVYSEIVTAFYSHRCVLLVLLGLFDFSWAGSYVSVFSLSLMPVLSHHLPETDWEVQEKVKEVFGFAPCLWQIWVVHTVLNGDDVITVARTDSGKSITYWIPVLLIKYGISVIVTFLKLLGLQFAGMLTG